MWWDGWLAGDAAMGLFQGALNASVKGAAILLLAWGIAAALRRAPAAARHRVWSLALAALLVLPALTTTLPNWRVDWLPRLDAVASPQAAPAATPAAGPATDAVPPDKTLAIETPPARDAGDPASPSAPAAEPESRATAAPPASAPLERATPAAPEPGNALPFDWLSALPWLWALGALAVLGRFLLGMASVRWMTRRASPVVEAGWQRLLALARTRMGVDRAVRLWKSDDATTPMTWGLRRPVVLLPQEADSWDEDKRTAVLLHELAHIRRRDTLTQTLAQLACALHWFNPLVWLAARRLRVEREHACDDAVLAAGTRASEYAAYLLDIARSLRSVRVASFATIAMARRSQLEGRLLAILNPRRNRRALTPIVSTAIVGLILFAAVPLAALRPMESQNGAASAPRSGAVSPADAPEERVVYQYRTVELEAQALERRVDSFQQDLETGPDGEASAALLQRQADAVIRATEHVLQMTVQKLNVVSVRLETSPDVNEEAIAADVESLSGQVDALTERAESLLTSLARQYEGEAARQAYLAEVGRRLKTEIQDEIQALKGAATRLVDAVERHVQLNLEVNLGPFGELVGDIVKGLTHGIKVQIQVELGNIFDHVNALILDEGTHIAFSEEQIRLLETHAGATERIEHEAEAFAREMEAFAESMESWGEAFGARIERAFDN